MPKNDEGEFELVLGNKQLLSVFFIVVVLLGVFFTMGYIVGRNTGVEAAAQMAAVPGQPLVVESETASAASSAPPTTPDPTQPGSEPPPGATPMPTPPPPTPPPTPRPVPPAKVEPPKTAAPRPVPTPAATPGEPASGQTFLQVAATTRPEAEVLRDVLAKRGFQCQLAPVPGQDLMRVLVGPVDGAEEISQTRSKLQAAGFKPFTRTYN